VRRAYYPGMKMPKWAQQAVKLVSKLHVWLFRLTRGWIGGRMMGCPVGLLTTKGRKSYRMITRPLFYLQDGEHYYVSLATTRSPRGGRT